eukprot:CAMPEP_0114290178 /NCGR_PEP_ID=MMETSP0059-20121206/7787_1 /TAXON_ID=36894 /ORGANISM="Pyramimonas parkeae, Strain CCMP726" /LENGTH=62 /DNA_ID=CAMNT_0001411537 /DNA_START=122 /DNA_END=310 /DNA_ORIENTATION=-
MARYACVHTSTSHTPATQYNTKVRLMLNSSDKWPRSKSDNTASVEPMALAILIMISTARRPA